MNTNAAPLRDTANNLAQYGRYGDSMLVHMNPVEVEGIASLSPTGRLTINPVTGQPEAFLPFLAPLIGGALGSAALTGAGAGILGLGATGLSSAMAGAIGSGLASWAESGDIKEGLISGLTGYGVGKALGALGGAAKTAEPIAALTDATGTPIDPMFGTTMADAVDASGNLIGSNLGGQTLSDVVAAAGEDGMSLGDRASFLAANKGEIIPNLMQQSPLIATGEMGRSQLQATKELEDSLGNIGEDDEENLQRQYDILGGAWDQLARDYNYPVQPYPRYSNNGGLVKRYQEGGLLTGGPEQAAARQAAIRGSVFVPPPETNAAGQPWRAGFDAEHNYFGRKAPVTTPPDSDQSVPPSNQPSPTINTSPLNFVTQGGEGTGRYLGGTAPDLVSGIPGAGQGYVGDFGGAETIQNLDYSDYPKRSDFGSSDDGGHIEFKQAENEWFQDKTPSTRIDQPVMPLEATSPVMPPVMPSQVIGMPPPIAPPPPPLPELGPRPKRSDYGREEGIDYKNDLREWNEAKNARGYAEGGIIDLMPNDESMMAEQPIDPAMQQEAQMADELIQQTVMAILGRVDDPDVIIDMFIDQFGQEAYLALREQVLNTVVPGAQTEGMIEGQGDGMSDEVMGMIGDQQQVATSPGEYIVPADVVSGIGNGSSDSGAQQLDGMINSVRQERTGTVEQPEAIIPEEMMP